jgi:hypothetical protein
MKLYLSEDGYVLKVKSPKRVDSFYEPRYEVISWKKGSTWIRAGIDRGGIKWVEEVATDWHTRMNVTEHGRIEEVYEKLLESGVVIWAREV